MRFTITSSAVAQENLSGKFAGSKGSKLILERRVTSGAAERPILKFSPGLSLKCKIAAAVWLGKRNVRSACHQ